MSKPLFCVECGGDLKHTDNAYKCLNCNKKYSQEKNNNQKQKEF